MFKLRNHCSIINSLALLAPLYVTVFSNPAGAANICHYDNPAYYVEARAEQTKAEQGGEITCAPAESAEEVPEELVLPMPCGHQIYFRRIDIRIRDILDYRTAYLGDSNAASRSTINKVSSIPLSKRISGSFRRPEPEGLGQISYYYIGKYELTEPQWRLYSEGFFARGLESADPSSQICQEHIRWLTETQRPVRVLPATNINWFDANDFVRAYTNWVLNLDRALIEGGGRPLLPWQQGTNGFLRLPTNAEWEFAARAGEVDRDGLSRAYYQIEQDGKLRNASLEEIAQIGDIVNGVYVAGIGKRLPNKFMLFDMLGNAAELVLDLFEPTRPDGLTGLTGGAVIRGGSSQTPKNLIGLGYRQEAPMFDSNGEVRSATVGARIAISAPFFVSGFDPARRGEILNNADLYQSVEASLSKLSVAEDGSQDDLVEFENQIAKGELGERAQQIVNAALSLARQSRAARIQATREALVERYVAVASLLLGTDRTAANAYEFTRRGHALVLNLSKFGPEERAQIKTKIPQIIARAADIEKEVDVIFKTYIETVSAIVSASDDDRKFAAGEASQRIQDQGAPRMDEAIKQAHEHIQEALDNGAAVSQKLRNEWLDDADSFRSNRRNLVKEIVAAQWE